MCTFFLYHEKLSQARSQSRSCAFVTASPCKQRFRSRFNTLFAGARKASIDRDGERRFFRRVSIRHVADFYYFPNVKECRSSDKHNRKIKNAKSGVRRRQIRSPINLIRWRGWDSTRLRHVPHGKIIPALLRVTRTMFERRVENAMPPPREYRAFARSCIQIEFTWPMRFGLEMNSPAIYRVFPFENVYVTYGGSSRGSVDRKVIPSRRHSIASHVEFNRRF